MPEEQQPKEQPKGQRQADDLEQPVEELTVDQGDTVRGGYLHEPGKVEFPN